MKQSLAQLQPIIIVGMHRSGTTLVANSLRSCGLFTGENLDKNGEPRFFLGLNEWLFGQIDATWNSLIEANSFKNRPKLTQTVKNRLLSRAIGEFTGKRMLRKPSLLRLETEWGWKDPRTTQTLPIWLDIFPKAKVIHVLRNGTDVALSLRKRETKKAEIGGGFLPYLSERCLEFDGGLSLWESYVSAGLTHLSAWPESQQMTVKYEAF